MGGNKALAAWGRDLIPVVQKNQSIAGAFLKPEAGPTGAHMLLKFLCFYILIGISRQPAPFVHPAGLRSTFGVVLAAESCLFTG